jgi:arylsulfatase A-like enzyme
LASKREFGPRAHGFDEFFGFLEGAHDFYVGGLLEDTVRVPTHGYLTDEITRRSVDLIMRPRSAPFFLEVAYNAVHWPFQPPNRPPRDTAGRIGQRLLQLHMFLFDLSNDPGERVDLAARRPDMVRSMWGLCRIGRGTLRRVRGQIQRSAQVTPHFSA